MRHTLILTILGFSMLIGFARGSAPQTADSLWESARLEYEARRYDQAQPLFDEFRRRYTADNRTVEAQVYAALCVYHRGRKAQSVVDLNRLANSEIMHKRRSRALLLALDQLALHYRQDNKAEDWRKTIGQLYQAFPEEPATVREMRLFARQCLEDSNWDNAIQAFSLIKQHLTPADRNGLHLARVMNSTEGGTDVILRIANTQLESDAIDIATRLYNEALKRQPAKDERLEIQTKLGWCLYLQNKHADAEKLWSQVISEGSAGDPWRGRSRWHLIALNAGPYSNTRKAMELCEVQAREFEGGFMGQQAMLTRAWLLKINKKWADAKIAFEALIATYPHKAESPPIRAYIEECNNAMSKR